MVSNITLPFRKPADSDHPSHELISERWSPRAFDDRPVEQEKIASLFEAARWAASTANQQPWRFVYATKEDADAHARVVSFLAEGNVPWARNAPLLIVTVAKLYSYAGKENHSFYDVGMAVQNLVLQAVSLGLVVHQMGGFDAAKAKTELGIPDGYEPLAVIAVGYQGRPDTLSERYYERELLPRVRKPLDEVVSAGQWDEALNT